MLCGKKTSSVLEGLQKAFDSIKKQRLDSLKELKKIQILNQSLIQCETKKLNKKLGKEHPRVKKARIQFLHHRDIINHLNFQIEMGKVRPPKVERNGILINGRIVGGAYRGISGLKISLESIKGKRLRKIKETKTAVAGYYFFNMNRNAVEKYLKLKDEIFLTIRNRKNRLVFKRPKKLEFKPGLRHLIDVQLDKRRSECCTYKIPQTDDAILDPTIDYVAKDYDSFRLIMIDSLRDRVPTWEPSGDTDSGVLIIDLIAAVGDYLSHQQDKIMSEAYLSTARRRISIRRHSPLTCASIAKLSIATALMKLSKVSNRDTKLVGFTDRSSDDPGIALLEGASILADILTYYQELYANEAFLRTAKSRQSIADLVKLLGYQLSPGLETPSLKMQSSGPHDKRNYELILRLYNLIFKNIKSTYLEILELAR